MVTTFPEERIAVDQPQGGSCYPFLDHDTDELLLRGVGDFSLLYEDPSQEFVWPFSLVYLYGLGVTGSVPGGWPAGVHDYDVIVYDALGAEVFASHAADYTANPWSDRFTIVQWVKDLTIARLVVRTGFRAGAAPTFPAYLIPDKARLQPRTLEIMHRRPTALQVGVSTLAEQAVQLTAGYNLQLASASAVVGRRVQHTITFNAVPGAGLGVYSNCDDFVPPSEADLLRISGVGPDAHGNFIVATDPCYRLQPEIAALDGETAVLAGGLMLHQDACTAPCPDEGWVGLYRTELELWSRILAVGAQLEGARDIHRGAIGRFEQSTACKMASPVGILIRPRCGCGADIGVSFCNQETCQTGPLELTIDIAGTWPEGQVSVPKRSIYKNNGRTLLLQFGGLGGTYPTFTTSWDQLAGKVPALLRFGLRGSGCTPGQVTVTVTAVWQGQTYTQVGTADLLIPDEAGDCF